MVVVTISHRFGGTGYLVCDKCRVKSEPVEFWSVDPLNFANPLGWTDCRLQGTQWGHCCPACRPMYYVVAYGKDDFVNVTIEPATPTLSGKRTRLVRGLSHKPSAIALCNQLRRQHELAELSEADLAAIDW